MVLFIHLSSIVISEEDPCESSGCWKFLSKLQPQAEALILRPSDPSNIYRNSFRTRSFSSKLPVCSKEHTLFFHISKLTATKWFWKKDTQLEGESKVVIMYPTCWHEPWMFTQNALFGVSCSDLSETDQTCRVLMLFLLLCLTNLLLGQRLGP